MFNINPVDIEGIIYIMIVICISVGLAVMMPSVGTTGIGPGRPGLGICNCGRCGHMREE